MISSAKGAFRPSGSEDDSPSKEDGLIHRLREARTVCCLRERGGTTKQKKAFGASMAENEGKLNFPLPIIGDVYAAIKMNLFYHSK